MDDEMIQKSAAKEKVSMIQVKHYTIAPLPSILIVADSGFKITAI